jgi:hypothetical protein
MTQARAMLSEVYQPEGVEVWLHSRNAALDGRIAAEMLAQGEAEPVLAAVERLLTGAVT